MRKLFTALLLSSAAAAPAFAQDAGAPAEATFTGPRVEAIAGYDKLGSNGGVQGLAYGGGVGFDFDLGGFVAGVEGEYVDSNSSREDVFADEDTDIGASFDVSRDLYVGGRAGFRATPSTLVYAKAGYTNTKLKFGVDNGVDDRVDVDGTVDGYRLGAGVEQVIGTNTVGNAYVKLEYRYSNYGDFSFDDDLFDDDDLDSDIDIDRHQVVAGIGLRF